MAGNWSFGRKIGGGFALMVLLEIGVGGVATYALQNVVQAKDRVLDVDARALVAAQRFETVAESRISAIRGFLLTQEPIHLADLAADRVESETILNGLIATRPELNAELISVKAADADFGQSQDSLVELARAGADRKQLEAAYTGTLRVKRIRLSETIAALTRAETAKLETAKQLATDAATSSSFMIVVITGIGALVAAVTALLLTRTLGRQINSAVGQVQSSSAELQASANQQASGLRQQGSAVTEITTTISELLATSRQIAESAQRVAEMASQTSGSARSGDETVTRAHESIASIQRQVELIVLHMLELGRKSQQIGTVLEIVSELAEQTNILAINATIEATGAGESGRRFAVVADEIRKLADRVTGSTKEIRTLIDDVRSAVNTTVMATETGSKTVDAGSRQFGEVANSLRQISELAGTTKDAAREIELSTKQQTTAVEQVSVAIANVAQASRETESSASQTLQTASQLAKLSRELMRVVQPSVA